MKRKCLLCVSVVTSIGTITTWLRIKKNNKERILSSESDVRSIMYDRRKHSLEGFEGFEKEISLDQVGNWVNTMIDTIQKYKHKDISKMIVDNVLINLVNK